MDGTDRKLKEFFARERRRASSDRPAVWEPTDEDYYLFVTDALEGEALVRMLEHLKTDRRAQEVVSRARELAGTFNESEAERVPARALERAKALSKGGTVLCPHCGKPITPFKRPPENQRRWNALWLFLAAAAFLSSFVFGRYFLQFLALALFFGVKWVINRRATKTQILIYKALKEAEPEVSAERLHRVSSHL